MEKKADCSWIRTYAPENMLSSYINYYWVVTEDIHNSTFVNIYPDGGVGLIFNLRGVLLQQNQQYGKGLFFDGANSRSAKIDLIGKTNVFGIRFKPGGFNRFFNADLSKSHNVFNALDSIGYRIPEYCFEIFERCISDREKITVVETWLACIYSEPDHNIALVQSALDVILENQSDVELQSFVNNMGVDIRRLQRLFKKQLGMSPGKLKRLIRATCARQLVEGDEHKSFSDITYICGYYDQAHFNREFKEIYGITPTVYRKRGICLPRRNLKSSKKIGAYNNSGSHQ